MAQIVCLPSEKGFTLKGKKFAPRPSEKGSTLKGKKFAPRPSEKGSTLKGKNFAPPGGTLRAVKQTGSDQSCISFKQRRKIYLMYPVPLKSTIFRIFVDEQRMP